MSGSLYRIGGWKPGSTNRPTAAPYRRRDPREIPPDTDWWKREGKPRAEQLAILEKRRQQRERLVHIPPARET